ncbi:MAG: LamG domain-containing protein [Okeania sp. SIO3B3]|nr:LamG domain-containing protein [Okeania sp. SIO3B3]
MSDNNHQENTSSHMIIDFKLMVEFSEPMLLAIILLLLITIFLGVYNWPRIKSYINQWSNDLDYGLVGHYTFDNVEELAIDVSNNGRNGRNIGAISEDGAAFFDGKSKIVIEGFRDFPWGTNLTVSVWFKRIGKWDHYQGIVNNGYGFNGSWEIRMGRENQGRMLGGGVITPTSPKVWDYINIQAAPQQWHHVVMKFDGKELLFYLDGNIQAGNSQVSGEIISKNTPVTIGQAGVGTDAEYFYGYIDEVRIYSRTLSFAEIKKLSEFKAN